MSAALLSVLFLLSPPPTPQHAVERFEAAPREAAPILAAAAKARPDLATALETLRAEALLAAGAPKQAAAAAATVMDADPRWAHRAAMTAARAQLDAAPQIDLKAGLDKALRAKQAPYCEAALEALERARPDPPWSTQARILQLKAEAFSMCGAEDEAEALLVELAVYHPATPEGRLAAQERELGELALLQRALAFEAARAYPEAEALLNQLLKTPLGVEARFHIGKLHLERLRDDFTVSIRAFSDVEALGGALEEEAAYLKAKAMGRAGDVVGALSAYAAYLKRWPKGRFRGDAEFFSVFLLYEQGRYADAAKGFAKIKRGGWAKAARWYRAWSAYLAEDKQAFALLDALAKHDRRAAYWAAQALKAKKPKAAAKRERALVKARPDDWYALLIRRQSRKPIEGLVGLAAPKEAPLDLTKEEAVVAEEVRALHAAGLPGFARRALSAAGLSNPVLVARLAREVEAPNLRMRATLISQPRLLRGAPSQDAAEAWRDVYPYAFRAAVNATPDPLRTLSFIRKESAFDPDAVSPAHAVGLMQLLPRTAQLLGGAEADLFTPAENIRLGALYLDKLHARFGGQLPLIAAAYNAGPPSLISWFKGAPSMDTDLFVELIPFKETRNYVKRLTRTLVRYRMIHEGMDLDAAAEVLPTTLDLTLRPGVNF